MKKYTEEEFIKIMDSVAFPKGLTLGQTITIMYWSLFNRNKLNVFCGAVDKGMALIFAYKKAKQFHSHR